MLSERQQQILEMAKRAGRVQVEDLAQRYEVSVQTIRKDLNELCDQRLLSRVHGGAILSSGVENVGYDARRAIAASEKAAIGRAVADLIPDRASLFVNIGTTTEAVAQALLRHAGLMVITNNINVATAMRPYPEIEVVIAGGVVRRSDGGIVGEAAVDFIRQFRVDFAVIGASAIDADGSLLDYDYREVRVAQAIISNARHVILASDATKFERSAPVRIGHLSQIDTFVTDHCPLESIRAVCAEQSVRLIETERS
ncbi:MULTISPECIES: DeoR/GlpR family DNA-binding transcription regulator [unclassified Aureimonas]|uniref:DeoR/GlpR family DNA-binding transcription regulator n=1 Tax=unclassified Aureimonas TaxID=2615206 RepID=UPI0006F8CA3E|nr:MULTISPECIES: DeoR/GlpR family DNA-binding transcription regulator [unclassified Aureimonas]KQT55347.1 DeoR family transcriptional regulator [Aureimonas sp. Leaf427]KQT71138.1 DeoR family transcriptional regulator [Aureimonas sp. Leaf460]